MMTENASLQEEFAKVNFDTSGENQLSYFRPLLQITNIRFMKLENFTPFQLQQHVLYTVWQYSTERSSVKGHFTCLTVAQQQSRLTVWNVRDAIMTRLCCCCLFTKVLQDADPAILQYLFAFKQKCANEPQIHYDRSVKK